MTTVELTVTVKDRKRLEAEISKAEVSTGPRLDGEISGNKLQLETLDLLKEWLSGDPYLSHSKAFRRKTLEVLGSHLFNLIFTGEIRSLFESCLDEVKDNEQLRVRLSFWEDAKRLNDMPWEYPFYPETERRAGFFFATELKLILTRYIRLNEKQKIEDEEGPLKVLFVVAQPENLEKINVTPIYEALEKLKERHQIDWTTLKTPTIEKIQTELRENRPHVLHFLGHSRFDDTRRSPEIALLDSDARTALWLDYSTFATFICEVRPSPRLVCLQMPDVREKQEFAVNFTRLAPEFIKREIPAVVATQYPLGDDAAVGFSRAFYGELAQGKRIDYAVQQGRRRIITVIPTAINDRVFGAPVLYIGRADRIIRPSAPRGQVTSNPGGDVAFSSVLQPERSTYEASPATSPVAPKLYLVMTAATVSLDSLDVSASKKAEVSSKLIILKRELASAPVSTWESMVFDLWSKAGDEAFSHVLSAIIVVLKSEQL